MKKVGKLVNIWLSYGQEFGVLFFNSQCSVIILRSLNHFTCVHFSYLCYLSHEVSVLEVYCRS